MPEEGSPIIKKVQFKTNKPDGLSYRNEWVKSKRRSTIFGVTKRDLNRVKVDIDRLWKERCSLVKKENPDFEDVTRLKKILTDAIDVTGRTRINVRDKENYDDNDVESFSKDINGLQMLFHGCLEIWNNVKEPTRKERRQEILSELMELATDLASLFGEVMSLFLQRFQLNILPMLRPVHGLFYAMSMHCRYNCLDREIDFLPGARNVYSSFLSGVLGLMRSAKVLLKRLKYENDQAGQRRSMIQNSISGFLTEISIIITQGTNHVSLEEYRQLMFKVGSLCTDTFFGIGKTKGIADTLEMGEGVVALEPCKHLGNVSYCDVIRCPVENRQDILDSLKLQDGQHMISDIFQITGSTFQSSERITLRFPISKAALPPTVAIKVKIKCGPKWMDVGGELNDGQVEFEAKFLQAFVAVAGYRAYHREIPLTGYTYISEDDNRVRINFPKDCFNKPVIVQFRLVMVNRARMFGYKDCCTDQCQAIIAISDFLFIKFDKDVDIKEPALMHLPIINDIDDPDSEIVMFRIGSNEDTEIIQKRSAMRCESTTNCYTFQVDRFNGIALGKVKKKFMKKSKSMVEDELRLYLGNEHMCSILTFLDKSLLHVGVVKIWIEIVDKRFVKRALRRRAKEGLFEIPGNRSTDIRLKENETVTFDTDGNIQKIREIPNDYFSIIYTSSCRDNYRSFPLEPRKDPRGRHVGIVNFFKKVDGVDTFLHTVTIDTNRFLVSMSRLKTSYSESRPGMMNVFATIGRTNQWSRGSTRSSTKSVRSSIQYRSIFDDVPILSHQSLLALSSAINIQVAQVLGSQLGLPYEDIMDIKSINQPPVVTIFEILWEWRGKVATPDQVEQLVQSFNQINQKYFADVILKANREKRGLTRKDFQ
ncbi:uncharacterized protein LOC117343686 isoform X2 [Pecten maximus]|uniref:uncharacterized protein LOC117343686 isoform X2 n=1 Tax=Pecten maximus TaxID=6579 RepID=UPI001458D789|nr:uncharacterized protein LOC117343686 isoform X2 [Pecten maximus]